MWFDSHCHLFECDEGGTSVIERARAAGVREMLVAGTDLETSTRAIALGSNDGVYAAAGVHPNSCETWDDSMAAAVADLAADSSVVAVGETGLDFYRRGAPSERQRAAFGAHIDLACHLNKALVVHTRASVDEALDALEAAGPPERVVFHCWSGDRRQMERALTLGAYVSFAGNISFKRSEELRTLARLVPEDRLVVETDSPYLAPDPHRGKPNEPALLPLVGAVVAAARGASAPDVAEVTTANARRLFGIPPRSTT
jgi:TatD DNase family protein